jgi:glycosyltransferase involved in cell wall biosynthesis
MHWLSHIWHPIRSVRSLYQKVGNVVRRDLSQHWFRHIGQTEKSPEIEQVLLASRGEQRVRILLVYNRVSHHMAEFVNVALRKRFPQVLVFGCGPNNEFHIPDTPDSHKRIAALVKRLQIDVLWELESGFVSNEFQFKRVPGAISAIKMWWVNDSHQFLDLMVQKAPYFDQMFVSMKDDVSAFGPHAIWLPGSASVDVAIDYHLPRTHDLTFVGSLDPVHQNRVEMIEQLSKVFPQMNIKQGVFLEAMARVLSASKMVFNISLKQDLNYRVFEALACGAMLLTDRIDNGLLDLFEDGKDLVIYDSFDDLKDKIIYYLEHSDERKSIARAGKQKVLQQNTVDHRISKVLGRLPELLQQQGKPVPPSLVNGAFYEFN